MTSSGEDLIHAIESGRRVLRTEAEAIASLVDRVGADFEKAVAHIYRSPGRVIVCGMGKSGIIGHKVSATLMSTGTPSFYMHPGEAYHGDLGMVAVDDTFIAISNSGETDEVVKLLPYLSANKNFLIALTGSPESTLARAANCHLNVGVRAEACPLQLAPTASTTAALAMGDAIAIAVMEARGFEPEDFAKLHPGGSLGRRLLGKVEDEMVSSYLPVVSRTASFPDVISSITGSNLGLSLVNDGNDWAIITDGDLRRAITKFGSAIFGRTAADIMTKNAASVRRGTRIEDALTKMERLGVGALLVIEGTDLVGIFKK